MDGWMDGSSMEETYQCQRVAQQDEARGVVGQFVGDVGHLGVDVVGGSADLERLLVDFICVGSVRFFLSWSLSFSFSPFSLSFSLPSLLILPPPPTKTAPKQPQNTKTANNVQITACGSLARDVPRRNLRSAVRVSGLMVYRRLSDDCRRRWALAPARGDVGVGVGTCHGWLGGWLAVGGCGRAAGDGCVCVTRVSSSGCVLSL
jgi:hypothetical protein